MANISRGLVFNLTVTTMEASGRFQPRFFVREELKLHDVWNSWNIWPELS